MLKKRIKASLVFLTLFGIIYSHKYKANAMMKKVVTNILGGVAGASRMASNTSGAGRINKNRLRNQVSTGKVTSYSSYVALRNKIKDREKLINQTLLNLNIEEKEGIFKTPTGEEVKLKIHTGETEDGLKHEKIINNIGNEKHVSTYNGENYFLSLQADNLLKIMDNGEISVVKAFDKLGKGKYITTITGNDGEEIAYEYSIGILRDINRGENGELYLGGKVEFEQLTGDFKNKVTELVKNISTYSSEFKLGEGPEKYETVIPKSTESTGAIPKATLAPKPKLPILTETQIKDLEYNNPGIVKIVSDEHGIKHEVVMADGNNGEKIAYVLSTGKFYKVSLSRKKKLIFKEQVEESSLSLNILQVFSSTLDNV